MKLPLKTFITSAIVLGIFACERFVIPENDTQISEFDDDESHYTGKNCMDCHYSAGRGEGWFTAAGSSSGNYSRATIELFRLNATTPFKAIAFDALGNAFTTEPIEFENGIQAGIRSSTGTLKMMPQVIHTGQCNLCHGATEKPLNINW